MKKVEAIVRPSRIHAIQGGLKKAGIPCMTTIPVRRRQDIHLWCPRCY